jgi:uncharacterized membrane-anchored protein
MSFARPRIARHILSACLVAITGLVFAISVSEAREKLRKQPDGAIEEIQRPSRRGYDDIILEMAPLHPWRGAAVKPAAPATKLAKPAPVKDAEPVEAAAKASEPSSADVQQAAPAPEAKAGDALKEDAQKDAAKTVASEPVKDAASNTAVSGEQKADVKNASVAGQSEAQPGTAAAPAVNAAATGAAPVANPTAKATAPTAPVSASSAAAVEAAVQPTAPQKPAAANAGNSGSGGAPVASSASAIQAAAPELQPVTNSGAPSQAILPPQVSVVVNNAPETNAKPVVHNEPVADASKASNAAQIAPAVSQAPQVSAATAPAQAPAAAATAPVAQEQNLGPKVAKDEVQPQAPRPQAEAVAPQTVLPAVIQSNEAKAYDTLLARGIKGPAEVRLSERATMWLPAGRVFLEAEQARKLLGVERGSWDDATQGVVLPSAGGPQWMAYVDLLDDGYIKDDEGKSLDANILLATYKAGVASQNPGRIRLGLTPLEVTGWLEAPTYDAKHRLSSCIGATGQGSQNPEDRIVNCTSFALGRQGAIKVIVAGDEAAFAHFKGEAAALANTIVYDKGETYEDADLSMDRVAGYGLFGLLTGAVALKKLAGAAVVASVAKKAGLLTIVVAKVLKLWKLLLGGLVIILLGSRWVSGKRKPAIAKVREEKPATPVKPVSAPIWTRATLALRARFAGAQRKAAAPQDALIGAEVEQSEGKTSGAKGALFASLRVKAASMFRKRAEQASDDGALKASSNNLAGDALDSTVQQAAAQSSGSALSKLASLMRGQAPQAGQVNAEPASDSPASALAKLASRMRKQAPQPVATVDVSRATNRKSQVVGASSGFEAPAAVSSELRAPNDPPNVAPKPAAVQPSAANAASVAVASVAADLPALVDDPLGLVEPGDEAAAASAISAREALREAHG